MHQHYTFVTGNRNKYLEFKRILNIQLFQQDVDLPEIQSINIEDVVVDKVKAAYFELKRPVMIEDTGLYFEAWNGLPGALIKWFLASVGNDGLSQMICKNPNKNAIAKTCIASYDGINDPNIFLGEVNGTIADIPRGKNGFGWDSIFIPNGYNQTFAEMTGEHKDKFSMRNIALKKATEYFKNKL